MLKFVSSGDDCKNREPEKVCSEPQVIERQRNFCLLIHIESELSVTFSQRDLTSNSGSGLQVRRVSI